MTLPFRIKSFSKACTSRTALIVQPGFAEFKQNLERAVAGELAPSSTSLPKDFFDKLSTIGS